jgi:hypothetical protein
MPVEAAGIVDGGLGAREPAFDQPGAAAASGLGTLSADEPPVSAEGEETDGGMEAREPILAGEAVEALPPEAGEAQPPPPESAMQGAPLFSPEAYQLPGPTVIEAPALPALQGAPQPPSPEMVALLVTDDQLQALWRRAEEAKMQVVQLVHNQVLALRLLDQIRFARNEILAGRDRYEEADRYLSEVEQQVAFDQRTMSWSNTTGIRLFFYEVMWALLFVTVLFGLLGEQAFGGGAGLFVYILASMVWGGVGGITGALLALLRHISRDKDFDIRHRLWYLSSPLMGMVVGLFIFAALQVGVISISGSEAVQSPFIIYLLAWLGGYQHNVFTDIVKRLLKVFELGEKKEEKT